MKTRDLLLLPIGSYQATDGIYKYTLNKYPRYESNFNWYSFRIKGNINGDSISFWEQEDYYFADEYRYRHGNWKHIILKASAGIGGIRIHSDDTYMALSSIKFLPRGSFKQYVQNEITP